MLLWAFFFLCLLFVYICVTGWRAECDSQPAGAVDLGGGGLPSGNRSASCIDFYFHGWVIWVSALKSQLGCHQGQLGRQGICFCLHQFHAVDIDVLSEPFYLSAPYFSLFSLFLWKKKQKILS